MYDPQRGYPVAVPYLLYREPAAASAWISEVLGFREVLRFTVPDGGPVGHVELERGGAIVMLGRVGETWGETASITFVFVDDVDVVCRRAEQAGGQVRQQPTDKPFGLRQAVVADPEGQRWEVSQHLRDVPAADWGAVQHGPMPG